MAGNQMFRDFILKDRNGNAVKPKTNGQVELSNAIFKNKITFGLGPAGTGKTFLAVAAGLSLLWDKEVDKIVLTRPAVESARSLGLLPGELEEKYEPFLAPYYDALSALVPKEKLAKLFTTKTVEIKTLSHMRGTNQRSFLIVDEAQNCTVRELQMIITRYSTGGKFVLNGDPEQSDLPKGLSGLKPVCEMLKGIKGVGAVEMSLDDIVRDELVKQAIIAFRGSSC